MEEQTRLVKAAIYVRVSTEEQAEKGASLDAQENKLRAWAEFEHIEVVKAYRDEGKSGKDLNRPDLSKLRKEASKGLFSMLLIYHNDRLSRSTRDTLDIVEELYKAGVTCRFYNFDTDLTTPEGELLLTNLAAFSQYFRKDLARKTSLGMQQKKKEGVHIGSLPFFLEKIDPKGPQDRGNLQVKAEYLEMIKTITALRNGGTSWNRIAQAYRTAQIKMDHHKVKRIYETAAWFEEAEA